MSSSPSSPDRSSFDNEPQVDVLDELDKNHVDLVHADQLKRTFQLHLNHSIQDQMKQRKKRKLPNAGKPKTEISSASSSSTSSSSSSSPSSSSSSSRSSSLPLPPPPIPSIHLLPFHLDYDGAAPVSSYFHIRPIERVTHQTNEKASGTKIQIERVGVDTTSKTVDSNPVDRESIADSGEVRTCRPRSVRINNNDENNIWYDSSFRGRQLTGQHVELADDQIGIVWETEKGKSDPDWKSAQIFDSFVVWHRDQDETDREMVVKTLKQWTDLARVLHS